MRYWPAFFLFAIANAQPPRAHTALLDQIRTHVAQNVLRLPNYTCTEIIERQLRLKRRGPFQPENTVRLNVAYVGGKELFGLPGTGRIDAAHVERLVRGQIETGEFAQFLKTIFVERNASFGHARRVKRAGKPAFRFDYQAPLSPGGIRIRSAAGEAIVGFRGTFWVDRTTLGLMRLIASADHPPRSIAIASDVTAIDYAPISIGGQEFRLPSHAQWQVKDVFGAEARSMITFERCREYVGESVLSFDDSLAPGK